MNRDSNHHFIGSCQTTIDQPCLGYIIRRIRLCNKANDQRLSYDKRYLGLHRKHSYARIPSYSN